MAKNVKLGSIAKDRISGFTGVVSARHEYLTGCDKIDITPLGLDKDGLPHKSQWFDEQACEVLSEPERGKYVDVEKAPKPVGGPSEMPRRTL
jgi:hypothetical protein